MWIVGKEDFMESLSPVLRQNVEIQMENIAQNPYKI